MGASRCVRAPLSRAAKSEKSARALAPEGCLLRIFAWKQEFFRSLFSPCGMSCPSKPSFRQLHPDCRSKIDIHFSELVQTGAMYPSGSSPPGSPATGLRRWGERKSRFHCTQEVYVYSENAPACRSPLNSGNSSPCPPHAAPARFTGRATYGRIGAGKSGRQYQPFRYSRHLANADIERKVRSLPLRHAHRVVQRRRQMAPL